MPQGKKWKIRRVEGRKIGNEKDEWRDRYNQQ
jgi:hypothetical protein